MTELDLNYIIGRIVLSKRHMDNANIRVNCITMSSELYSEIRRVVETIQQPTRKAQMAGEFLGLHICESSDLKGLCYHIGQLEGIGI